MEKKQIKSTTKPKIKSANKVITVQKAVKSVKKPSSVAKKTNQMIKKSPVKVVKKAPVKKIPTTSKVVNKKPRKKLIGFKNTKKRSLRFIIFASILGIGIVGFLLMIIFALYVVFTTGDFDKDLLYNKEMSVLLDKNGDEYARLGAENREIIYFEEIPDTLVDAIVATEDSRFFQHNGLDIARFAKASVGQLSGNSSAGGASTLTMQVSKQRLTSYVATGFDGIVRKFQDIYLSIFKIEKEFTKEEIIEFYVNVPWLGNSSWGIEAASQLYFGKSVRDLTLSESALIAGIFNLPTQYNPYANIDLATKRRSVVLDLMVRHGYITEEQKEAAESISVESLILLPEQRSSGINEYQTFVDAVQFEVYKELGVWPADVPMVIETTMDPDVQDVLTDLVNEEFYTFKDDVVETAISITDTQNGAITAVLGRRNQTGGLNSNLAIDMKRHPGSSAKPIFDYAPYLEFNNGSTYSPFFDEKYSYSNGVSIKNSDNSYMGLITMRTALARSRNIPALQAFQAVNKGDIQDFVNSLGITFDEEIHEAMSIGGFDGVSPVQLSAAYAAFGNGGYYIEPYIYTKITYIESDEVVEHKPHKERVMSEETAFMINSMLKTAANSGIAGNLKVSGTDIGAKTGTSTYDYQQLLDFGFSKSVAGNLSRDNWVNVYSPDYSISIWYGYEYLDLKYYTTALGGNSERVKISQQVANRVFKKNSKFDYPNGVVKAVVELETFPPQLASANTPSNLKTTEYFKKGTEPDTVSKRFAQLDTPSNGSYSSTAGVGVISWDAIATPEAIETDALSKYFDKYFSEWSDKYYNKRVSYNNANIGTVKYNVYSKSGDTLTKLGETDGTSYSVTCAESTCTYVVKASYTIFGASESAGLNITATATTGGNTSSDELSIRVKESKVCFATSTGNYSESNPVIVEKDGVDITSQVDLTTRYFLDGKMVSFISMATEGSYRIEYSVKFKNQNYVADKIVNICKNGCSSTGNCL